MTKKNATSESRLTALLEQGLKWDTTSRSFCSVCSKTQILTHSKAAVAAPKVLSINVNMPSDIDNDFFDGMHLLALITFF
jgi:hypothetical protein